jgi:hypothetical protein
MLTALLLAGLLHLAVVLADLLLDLEVLARRDSLGWLLWKKVLINL